MTSGNGDGSELYDAATQDLDVSLEQLAQRWEQPFNIVEDVFRIKDIYGNLVPYKPYPYAVDFINHGFYHIDKDRVVLKSRQLGFSTIAEVEAVITAMTFEDTEVSFISGQFKQARKLIETAGTIIKNAKYPLPFDEKNIQKERIKSDTGTTIVPYSGNPDAIRGDNSIKVFLDEFAFVYDQTATMDAVEPKVSRGGQVTMMSTPLRKDDLFMDTYNKAKNGEIDTVPFYCPMFDMDELDVNTPLTEQNLTPICDDIDVRRVEKVRMKSVNRFLQEYMCQPVDDINAYYPYDLILACVDEGQNMDYTEGLVTMGIDHALVKDETSIAIDNYIGGNHNTVHIESTRDKYHDQLERIRQLFMHYRPQKIRVDATGEMGVQIHRDLRDMFGHVVEGVTYNNQNKNDMAMRLKMYMQNTYYNHTPCIRLPQDSDLISELHNMSVEVTAGGNVRYTGKSGGNLDDMVNALWLSLPPEPREVISEPILNKGSYNERKEQGLAGMTQDRKTEGDTPQFTVSRGGKSRRTKRQSRSRSDRNVKVRL